MVFNGIPWYTKILGCRPSLNASTALKINNPSVRTGSKWSIGQRIRATQTETQTL